MDADPPHDLTPDQARARDDLLIKNLQAVIASLMNELEEDATKAGYLLAKVKVLEAEIAQLQETE